MVGHRKPLRTSHVPFLGALPLDPKIRRGGDAGRPIVVEEPDSMYAAIFRDMCARLVTTISTEPAVQRLKTPRIDQT